MPRRRNTRPLIRTACDECHAHKLRCQQLHDKPPYQCTRCLQRNVMCVFSPRKQRARYYPGSDTANSVNYFNIPDMQQYTRLQLDNDTNWTVGDDMIQLSQETPLIYSVQDQYTNNEALSQQATLDHDPLPWCSLEVSTSSTPSLSDGWLADQQSASGVPLDVSLASENASTTTNPVRVLADLNVSLYEHMATLPPISSSVQNRAPSTHGRVFAIDKTFQMTQMLVDTLKQLRQWPSSPPLLSTYFDAATVLLILSCSDRIFSLYRLIFGHMRGCIRHKMTPVDNNNKTILIPQLRIGSFTPPTPSAISMQMLLIILTASELFDQLRGVLGIFCQQSMGQESSDGNNDSITKDIIDTGMVSKPVSGSHGRWEDCVELGTSEVVTGDTPVEFQDLPDMGVLQRAKEVATDILNTRKLLLALPTLRGEGALWEVVG
ncbi:hypothetical protein VHEMI01734 [[Torrubiella] hemipterigena]|uniref:Zn(2)-C6 fungal-type domain-containing protein n=1 Tax=[Torrubiella] hemipterigena TaxID=1531966 RepID=A0A0A1T8E1_9HYPO|nr:hypothetical protein VHEMI01734 [[Torrubiella] hemipterigena]